MPSGSDNQDLDLQVPGGDSAPISGAAESRMYEERALLVNTETDHWSSSEPAWALDRLE